MYHVVVGGVCVFLATVIARHGYNLTNNWFPKAGGQAPLCQTIYAHYLLHLYEINVQHQQQLEQLYSNVTQTAIHNGMLQDQLTALVGTSVYSVEGQGFRLTPSLGPHHHHQQQQDDDTTTTTSTGIKHSSYHQNDEHRNLNKNKNNKPCTRFLRSNQPHRLFQP